MPNFKVFGFKVSPSFTRYKHQLSILIQDDGFARLIPPHPIGIENERFLTKTFYLDYSTNFKHIVQSLFNNMFWVLLFRSSFSHKPLNDIIEHLYLTYLP